MDTKISKKGQREFSSVSCKLAYVHRNQMWDKTEDSSQPSSSHVAVVNLKAIVSNCLLQKKKKGKVKFSASNTSRL